MTIPDVHRPHTPVGQRLGDLLFDAGLVTEAQLGRALVEQQYTGERLGRLLVAADVITEAELINILARHFGLDCADLEERVPNLHARRLLRECILHMASERADVAEERQRDAAVPRDAALDAPVVQFVSELLTRAVAERASDVHLEPNEQELRVRFRVDGILHDVMAAPHAIGASVVSRIKLIGGLDVEERDTPQDGRVTLALGAGALDIRLVTLPTTHGESLVIRILDRSTGLLQVDDLGFLPDTLVRYRSCYRRPWGAVLATGPNGSGKSTTLYAALSELQDPQRNIVTVEDPVEYHLAGIKQVQVNRKAGLTFASALRSIVRADPDILLVGELRDGEAATIALETALTGHLVLSTLHSNDAASTPGRLLDMGVDPFLVTSALSGVLAQRLVRQLCGACKEPYSPRPDELAAAGWDDALDAAAGVAGFHRAVGCERCGGSGYHGRLAIHEVLPLTEELTALILARSPSEALRDLAVAQGMTTMRRDGLHKVALGRTTLEELVRVVV